MKALLALVAGYLLGSISFGYLVARYWKRVDIRNLGSGNIGATNVYRILGPVPGIVVFAGDFLKGTLAAYLGLALDGQVLGVVGGIAALAGHSWPVFLGFRGGKVISTGAGILFAFNPLVAFLVFLIWYIVMKISGYVSLASVVAAVAIPILMLLFRVSPPFLIFGLTGSALAIYKHIPNIKRLLAGTEHKVGQQVKKR